MNKKLGILGGGIAAISFSYFYENNSTIIEKESTLGGLCRSIVDDNNIPWDIGPHITFSKNIEILEFIISLVEMNKLKRLNKVLYNKSLIKYPFENDLYNLPEIDRDYCLNTFLDNPFSNYESENMLEFFYETFGEGITRLYLEPYNRKIWKYEPSFMDKQMVERIPKPPAEDIIKSAKGISTEGYVHQLYFHYPKSGGFQSIVDSLALKINQKTEINLNNEIHEVKIGKDYKISTSESNYVFEQLISTIPIHELIPRISPKPPSQIMKALDELIYNSIHITCVTIKGEYLKDNFAITIADPNIIFHRMTRLNFLGPNYHKNGYTNIMIETTFRKGLKEDISSEKLEFKIIEDLNKTGLVDVENIENIFTNSFKYAYVIYDKNHRKNTDLILNYLNEIGINALGRFGIFEYINSDKVIEMSKEKAEYLNQS